MFKQLFAFCKKMKQSIVFKMAVVYVVLFSFVLLIAATVTNLAFAKYDARYDELDRTMSFVVSRLQTHQKQPFNFEEFARYSKTMIVITNLSKNETVRYGELVEDTSHKMQIERSINRPERRMVIKIVSTEYADVPLKGRVAIVFVFTLVVLLLSAVFLGSRSTKKLLQPVYTMTQTARSITANDLSVRIDEKDSSDELGELARTFNEMLDRLEVAYRKQNQFVSDASHELRTPLSVISGYANLLRRWGSADPAVLEESVSKIIEESENMQHLVERLLFLARVDQQTQEMNLEYFNASELMSQILQESRLIDDEHTIHEQIELGVMLTADRALILQAVRAVMENSMKYTPPGGNITVFCSSKGGQVCLGVSDTGIGIQEKDLPYIFDRFFKADQARSRLAGGTGLGLSIVKWIAERHGGRVTVTSELEKGSEFRIYIPELSVEEFDNATNNFDNSPK